MQKYVLPEAFFEALCLDQYGVCAFEDVLLNIPCRGVRNVPKNARTVVVFGIPYYVGAFAHRNTARYAMLPDYHGIAGHFLASLCAMLQSRFPQDAFTPFADASPFDEVELGVRAGLGVRGRNGQLINQKYGSYIFIAEIVTTVPFAHSAPKRGTCMACGKCVAACPGGALGDAGFCRERCLSFLTQKKRLDDPRERKSIAAGGMVWGCDICADVCPMNRRAAYSPIDAFYRHICAVVTHNNLDTQGEARAWAYKGRTLMERNIKLITEGSLWKS